MESKQKKGVMLIVGGVLAYFILPRILGYIGYMIGFREIGVLGAILAIGLLVLGVLQLLGKFDLDKYIKNDDFENETENQIINSDNQPILSSSNQSNKVVNVTLKGGIIGMLADSPQNTLNRRIRKENMNGWKVIQVIPASSGNILLLIFRIILLVITVFFFTTANGYYIIMEKE